MTRDAVPPWADEVLATADDLMAISGQGWRYELAQGRLIRMPPTRSEQGALGLRLGAGLLEFVDQGALGRVTGAETGFLLSQPGEPDTVLAPYIAFIAAHRLPSPDARDWKMYPRPSPELVVVIASPAQCRPEMAVKAKLCLDAGVRHIWVIWPSTRQEDVWHFDPAREMRTLESTDVLDGESVVPGFAFPLARLWL